MVRPVVVMLLALHVLLGSLSDGGLVEVLRLPTLVEHYELHQGESQGTLSMTTFLFMHYVDPAHEGSDRSHHGQLPFGQHLQTLVLLQQGSTGPIVPPVFLLPAAYAPDRPEEVGRWLGRTVFHPPKGVC